jgi:hypothetical protein
MLGFGCAPVTVIRRTALINAPQAPSREGQSLKEGQVRLTGNLIGVNTAEEGTQFRFTPGIAEVGDPGVLIPDLQIGASVWTAVAPAIEVGAQFFYASMGWADPNVVGVLPFPRGEQRDLYFGGIGLRLNADALFSDRNFALGLLTELNVASIPEAIFLCSDQARCMGQSGSTNAELYIFDRVETQTFFLPNLALQFGYRFSNDTALKSETSATEPGKPDALRVSVMPFLMLGVQASVTNTGFEPDLSTLPEDSLERLWVGYAAIGVDAVIEQFVVGASLMLPAEGERAIDFGVVGNFRLGVQL